MTTFPLNTKERRPATIVIAGELCCIETQETLTGIEGLDFLWGHYDDTSAEGQALLAAHALRDHDTPDPASVAGGVLFDFMRKVSHKFQLYQTGDR